MSRQADYIQRKRKLGYPKDQPVYSEADFPDEVVPGMKREFVPELVQLLITLRKEYTLVQAALKRRRKPPEYFIKHAETLERARTRNRAKKQAKRLEKLQQGGSNAA